MYQYKGKCFGETIDLDEPEPLTRMLKRYKEYKNFKWVGQWRLACIKELGYALVYMKYLHPEFNCWTKQLRNVRKLCAELEVAHRIKTQNEDAQYWKGFLYRIHDEIENLC